MTPTYFRSALRCAAAAIVCVAMSDARGQVHVWTGGGAAADWSDPANWEDASVPQSPATAVVFEPRFGGRRVSRQNVADPFDAGSLLFNVSDTYFEVTGNPIRLRDFGGIFDDSAARGTRIIRAPLQFDGRVGVEAMPGTDSSPGLNLLDVSGPGSLSVRRGLVRLGRATYTGTATVSNGELHVGGWISDFGSPSGFVVGSTENQGDYLVRPATTSGEARLVGTGTIGLAPGKKITVENGGVLTPDHAALGPVTTTLAVNGDVRFGDGGRFLAFAYPDRTDLLDVNGTLDLTGTGDFIGFSGFVSAGSVVVAEYASRLGEFDVFTYTLLDVRTGLPVTDRTATLSYTSGPGAGPGQVVNTVVPEPAGAGIALIAAGAILVRRRRR